jgi:hypothetical protein
MSKHTTYELHVPASNKRFVPSVILNISGNPRLSFPSNPLKFIILYFHPINDATHCQLLTATLNKKINKYIHTKFYISLTVHLGIILVNNQLGALFYCIYLLHFELPSAIHQEMMMVGRS